MPRSSTQARHIEAVIFDCDGVLVDSEPAHDAATVTELASRGITVPSDFLAPHRGRRVADQIRLIADHYGLDFGELLAARESRFWRSVSEGVTPIPGSADCVRAIHGTGAAIAVATSGTRRWIEHVLDDLDLREYVSQVVSGDDVRRPKPDPEPYRRASELLGVPSDACAVVEDSLLGYQSGRAAGCSVVMLTPEEGPSMHAQCPDALAVVASMADVAEVLGEAVTGNPGAASTVV